MAAQPFNWAHDFALNVHLVYYRDQWFFLTQGVSKRKDLMKISSHFSHKTNALKKKIRRFRHNCGSLAYIILEIYR